jgi:sugar phosphate permease
MPKGYARYALAVMVGINFLNYLDRYILPTVGSQVQKEFHLSDTQFGIVLTAFLLVYAISAIPFGIWADRGVRRTVIGVGVTIWSLATLLTGLVRNFAQLFAARAILGVGEASYYPAGTSLLGDYFPKRSRGRAMSVWSAGTAFGIAVGFAGGALVAGRYGWRVAFYMTAVPGLVLAALAFRLREPLRGAGEAEGPRGRRARSITLTHFRALLRIPTLRATIAAETLLFFVLAGAANWLPTYLGRRFGLGLAAAGTLSGAALVLGGLIGTLAGGWLGDRFAARRPRANLEVGMFGFIAGAFLVAGALLAPSLLTFTPLLFVGVVALYLYTGPYTAIKQNVVVPTLRASAVTLALLIEHLLGDSYSPAAIGLLSDRLGSLRLSLLILLPPVLLLAAVAAATGLPRVAEDEAVMERSWAQAGA